MRRALPAVATGLAAVAVVLAVIAVVIVTNRSSSATATTPATPAPAPITPPPAPPPQIAEVQVDALDLGKLFATDTRRSPDGVVLGDPALATTLGLQPGDAIASLQGVQVREPFELHSAIMDASFARATRWYLEIVRAGHPMLVRYAITGDIAAAIRAQVDTLYNTPTPPTPLPQLPTPAPDPLLDTITKVDDDHYQIPKKTLDAILADPSTYARSLRITASIKNGQPNGVKLYAIRPSSPAAHLGFQNGDTVRAVNGKALDFATVLGNMPHRGTLVFDITRRGVDQTLTITITP